MPQKALLIKFENAGIFPETRRSSDKMYDLRSMKIKRKDAPVIDIPPGKFDWRHVSNVLHVLMGERPVPTIRETLLKPDSDIQEAAKQARVHIETPVNDRGYETREMMTARKTVKDAWQTSRIAYFLDGKPVQIKGGLLYWARLERLLGTALLDDFIKIVQEITGQSNVTKHFSAHCVIEMLHDNFEEPRVQDFCQKCIKASRSSLVNVIDPKGNKESITFHTGVGSKLNIQMVNSGPETIVKLSGTIFVPVNEELISRLSRGCAVWQRFLRGELLILTGLKTGLKILFSMQNRSSRPR